MSVGPICRGALFVVPLEGLGIIVSFVAERIAEFFVPVSVGNEAIPIVVPDLVSEMAEESSIGFVQSEAILFSNGVVGLFDIQGDQTVGVPGEDAWTFGWRAEEIEHDAVLFVFADFRFDRQAETEELCDESAFGVFDEPPISGVFFVVEAGNRVVQTAGNAEGLCFVGRDEPVAAGGGVEISAAPPEGRVFCLAGQLPGCGIGAGLERAQLAHFRHVAERCIAAETETVAEEDWPIALTTIGMPTA